MNPRLARERLAAAWSRLPARDRQVLALLFYEGLTPTEAARAMGCTVRDIQRLVETRLSRFALRLRATSPREQREEAPRRWAA